MDANLLPSSYRSSCDGGRSPMEAHVDDPVQVWHEHRAVLSDELRCDRCDIPWPCPPALRAMVELEQAGFFD